jgi:hypothetical protein
MFDRKDLVSYEDIISGGKTREDTGILNITDLLE